MSSQKEIIIYCRYDGKYNLTQFNLGLNEA
jgi:hypothetical protein